MAFRSNSQSATSPSGIFKEGLSAPVHTYLHKPDNTLSPSLFPGATGSGFSRGAPLLRGPPPRVKSHQSLNRFRRASTGGVPRGRGVRGAARGLERELKASGRHTKKHNNSIFRRDAPRISRPGKRRKKTAWSPSVMHATPRLSTSNMPAASGKKDCRNA